MIIPSDFTGVDAGFDMLDYNYAYYRPPAHSVVSRSEKRLWCAVIHQAFIDMLPFSVPGKRSIRSSRNPQHGAARDKEASKAAIHWLLNNQQDFTYVCLQAGVSPDVIRRAALILARRYSLIPIPPESDVRNPSP